MPILAGCGAVANAQRQEATNVGEISYGVYVLHLLVPIYLNMVGIEDRLPRWGFILSAVATNLLLAALSRRFLELHIMRAGRRSMNQHPTQLRPLVP